MQVANEQLEDAKCMLTDKTNKVKLPVFYSYATCVYAKTVGNAVMYTGSRQHNTSFYSVYPFYKLIAGIDF
jgi:hypothetical protein